MIAAALLLGVQGLLFAGNEAQGGVVSARAPVVVVATSAGTVSRSASLEERLVGVSLPTASNGSVIDSERVLVTIRDGHIAVDGRAAGRTENLRKDGYWKAPALRTQLSARTTDAMVLAAEPETPYIVIKKVLFHAGKAGLSDVVLAVRDDAHDTVEGIRLAPGRATPPGFSAAPSGSGVFGVSRGGSRARPVTSEIHVEGGGLLPVIVDAVVKRHLTTIRYCYERELDRSPNLAGTVVVEFEVKPDGFTASSRVSSSTLAHAGVESCLASRFAKIRFPAPKAGAKPTVRVPLEFSSSSSPAR